MSPDNVTLLIGNHDAHYMYIGEISTCTRFDRHISKDLNKIFKENIDLFQMSYQLENTLFTHAGISKNWFTVHKKIFKKYGINEDYSNISEVINKIALSNYRNCLHEIGYMRGGHAEYGGITWADIYETYSGYLRKIHHIVGHNQVKEIHTKTLCKRKIVDSITYCDTLHKTDFNIDNDIKIISI